MHLAAAVGVKLIMEKPVETITTNVQGTENVLRLADYYDCHTLVASTSEVYGKSMEKEASIDRLAETDDWELGPTSKRRWAYACSKAMDEFLARRLVKEEFSLQKVVRDTMAVCCEELLEMDGPETATAEA